MGMSIDHSFSKKNKKKGNFKLTVDFSGEQQSSLERDEVLKIIFALSRAIFELGKELSVTPYIHPEIIQSGFAWKCIQHSYFALSQES